MMMNPSSNPPDRGGVQEWKCQTKTQKKGWTQDQRWEREHLRS